MESIYSNDDDDWGIDWLAIENKKLKFKWIELNWNLFNLIYWLINNKLILKAKYIWNMNKIYDVLYSLLKKVF